MALVPVIKDNDWVSVRQAIAALSTLRMGPDAHPVYGGLTLTGLDGVLKTSSGVVFDSATLDDLGEGTTYKRLTFAQAVDLTDGGETTLHTHPTSGITEIDWGDIGGDLSDQIDLQSALDAKAPTNDILANIVFGNLTLNNTGLRLMDTNASHYLNIRCASDLTGNRHLTFYTGDYNTNITISGTGPAFNAITLGDWFNQSIKTTAKPRFAGMYLDGHITIDEADDGDFNIGGLYARIKDIWCEEGNFLDVYVSGSLYTTRDLELSGGTESNIKIYSASIPYPLWFNLYPDVSGNIFVDVPVGDLYFTAGGGDIRFDNENLITSGAITGGAITGTSLKLLETGATPTYYGILAMPDLSTADKTYTLPAVTGSLAYSVAGTYAGIDSYINQAVLTTSTPQFTGLGIGVVGSSGVLNMTDSQYLNFGAGGLTGNLGCDSRMYSDGTSTYLQIESLSGAVYQNPRFQFIPFRVNAAISIPAIHAVDTGGWMVISRFLYVQDVLKSSDSSIVVMNYTYPTVSNNLTLTYDTVNAFGKILTGTAGKLQLSAASGVVEINAALTMPATITAPGTTGNQTINKSCGRVNIAAAGTTVTVTNNKCTVNSMVVAVAATADATARVTSVVPAAGSFVINTVACTAETAFGFIVIDKCD